MLHSLTLRAFFFNAKRDYLPYYKNFDIQIEGEKTIKELLAMIQTQNSDFSYPKQKLILKINGVVVTAKETIESIVSKLGTSLQIDPVNSYRSNDGLRINDKDFMQSFELLAPYASEEDLKYYKTLYPLHYASESQNFERNYIGDAILVLAHKLIIEGSEHSEAILQAITNVDSGLFSCEYENNLFHPQDHSQTIETLKLMAKPLENPSLVDKLLNRFCKKKEREIGMIDALEDKTIAFYGASSPTTAKIVSFSRALKCSGETLLKENKTLALQKAGTTLLDAYDRGVEVIVIENKNSFEMFSQNFSAIESIMGRKMRGLELILRDDFIAQNENQTNVTEV